MLRAIDITFDHVPQQKLELSGPTITSLCQWCNSQGALGATIHCAILFGYLGMLRKSNLEPNKPQNYDKAHHLARGDITHRYPGLVIRIKWSKTRQRRHQGTSFALAAIPESILFPVAAWDQPHGKVQHSLTLTPKAHYKHTCWQPALKQQCRQLGKSQTMCHFTPSGAQLLLLPWPASWRSRILNIYISFSTV